VAFYRFGFGGCASVRSTYGGSAEGISRGHRLQWQTISFRRSPSVGIPCSPHDDVRSHWSSFGITLRVGGGRSTDQFAMIQSVMRGSKVAGPRRPARRSQSVVRDRLTAIRQRCDVAAAVLGEARVEADAEPEHGGHPGIVVGLFSPDESDRCMAIAARAPIYPMAYRTHPAPIRGADQPLPGRCNPSLSAPHRTALRLQLPFLEGSCCFAARASSTLRRIASDREMPCSFAQASISAVRVAGMRKPTSGSRPPRKGRPRFLKTDGHHRQIVARRAART